ncbi:MAG: hypothetical protein UIJ87_08725 [Anaerovoracaceae bacterium]|nr:hypothetical protein [Anaerovoracaceae bacterium]
MRINVEFLYTPPTADCMAGHKRVFWKGCPWKTIEYHLDWNGRFHGYALRIQQTWKVCRFIPPYSTNELSVRAICGKSSNITLTGMVVSTAALFEYNRRGNSAGLSLHIPQTSSP